MPGLLLHIRNMMMDVWRGRDLAFLLHEIIEHGLYYIEVAGSLQIISHTNMLQYEL
jgi:hypothetical protein